MPIRWDKRNKCWRFEFDRYVQGTRQRASKCLPRGWSQAQADAFDRTESARLYAVAAGLVEEDPLIDTAVTLYLNDKTQMKSYKTAAEHLAAIAWAYTGERMSAMSEVCRAVKENREKACGKGFVSDATVKQRLALLKAACRWAWKAHKLTKYDPTSGMVMPSVKNERHSYKTRREMLQICRACDNWATQIAIRVAFYTGMRLGEILRAQGAGDVLVLEDTKNGDRRVVPVHPKILHLLKFLPLQSPKITVQRAWDRAKTRAGFPEAHFHDLRHWAASEMVNAGIDLFTVGRVLGHKDQRSTARYSHHNMETLKAAVLKIGKRAA